MNQEKHNNENEKPILFSGEMVKAILAGNKTQTRRKATVHDWPTDVTYAEEGWGEGKSPKPKWLFTDDGAFNGFSINCPYGEPGDRLWVRETFQPVQLASEVTQWRYRATDEKGLANWKSSIFMPRKASRITLEITAVRVQRLQEINERDAEAEGCSHDFLHSDTCSNDNCALCGGVDDCEGVAVSAKENYRALWERINGKGSWDANPWVWVVSFKKVFNATNTANPPAVACAGCGNDYNPQWNRSRTGKSAKQCATCSMRALEKFLSEPPDGYCWCNMCGYNAHLEGKDRAKVESDEPCPVCKEAGDASLLCVGDELDESVTADDPMLTWPETDPHTPNGDLSNGGKAT